MKQTLNNYRTRIITGVACIVIAVICWNGGNTCQAQANLSPGLQEVVKLTKSQMTDDIIISYIQNSGTAYHLSADDMLYLKNQGVSQPVISALLQAKAAAAVPAAVPTPMAAPAQVPPYPVAQPVAVPPPPAEEPAAPAPEGH